ncbi:hypothetical protein N7G274_010025 [Stereocaulon virgatum]|uniref:DUF8212 domain-containing protein n=1 Tax=Stereocaulon virgatum TaxID=373712 RepID=A0ABR3ZX88_9LECA
MFCWYEGASVCCVYLEDVVWTKDASGPSQSSLDQFRQSAWFTRGWALQELLAPENVPFYDQSWTFIGPKTSLSAKIAAVTGINEELVLRPAEIFYSASHTQKMSWMPQRRTTRAEDIAYCLLGLFKVNIPLLYGEGGERAFTRLQMEIIRKSDDESLFAWQGSMIGDYGMLASSRRLFAE